MSLTADGCPGLIQFRSRRVHGRARETRGAHPMRVCRAGAAFLPLLLLAGCANRPPTAPGGQPDPESVRAADYSVLFVGNSHTTGHDLPTLVCKLIQFRH